MLTVDFDRLGLQRGERLLDLGCGGGRHAFEAMRRGARVVALITLDPDALADWAKENDVSGDYASIVASEACEKMVQGYVEELNRRLNRWETIKKWELLDHDLSVESGELTPSMKVKRNVVEANNKARIDAFYSAS